MDTYHTFSDRTITVRLRSIQPEGDRHEHVTRTPENIIERDAKEQMRYLVYVYTVSRKKGAITFLAHNFAKRRPIFKILSLADSIVNGSETLAIHHTVNMSLHYLVKH